MVGSGNRQGAALPTRASVILLIFGCVFVAAGARGLHSGLQAAVRIVAVVAALVLFTALSRVRKAAAPGPRPGRWFWMIVAAELVALAAGLVVINAVARAHALSLPWIAVVVGVHFFAFIPLWRARFYAVLGVVVTVLGAAGFVLYAAGAPALAVQAVSGIGPGAALYLAAADPLVRLRRSRVGAGRPALTDADG